MKIKNYFKNKNRIIAFGCSLTYGEGLKDCLPDPINLKKAKYPSKYAWPNLLSKKTNIPIINNGQPGESNKLIANNIYRVITGAKFYR